MSNTNGRTPTLSAESELNTHNEQPLEEDKDTKQPTDSEEGHSSKIKQEADLEEGDSDGIQQQQAESAVIQEKEKSPEKESLEEGDDNDIKQPTESAVIREEEARSAENKRLGAAEDDINKLKEKLVNVESALKEKEEKLQSLQQEHNMMLTNPSMKEMETFYKEKLTKTDATLKQKEEELKSFKKRLAAGMAVSLKTGNTESLNNPVSKTRLTEMYDNLKLLQWPKTKDLLKSSKLTPGSTQGIVQKTFRDAFEEMKKKKQQIEEVFGLTKSSSELTPQKVKEYKQLTVQNLQMALFHTSKDLLKTGFPEHGGQYSEEEMLDLRPLTSECYWLGCLMALTNPPLQPDWENHVPSMDPWDIFPRDIKSFAL